MAFNNHIIQDQQVYQGMSIMEC